MLIPPHKVVETIMDRNMRHVWSDQTKVLSSLGAMLTRAVSFEIPDDLDLRDHIEFAVDMQERGLFGLPFPIVALSGERNLPGGLGRTGYMMLLAQREAGDPITCAMVTEMKNPGDRGTPIPIAIMHNVTTRKVTDGTQACEVEREKMIPLIGQQYLDAMYGPGVLGAQRMEQRLLGNVTTAMGQIVLLMSRGVETKLVPAPRKLNVARAKKKRPPIRDRYVVTIQAGGIRAVQHPDGSESDITGHTRGSPRPHWRRGHFRTIHRDTEHERVVPVAPALIGLNETAQEAIRPKSYKVQA